MSKSSVLILAIDGGGIRGIIPAYILEQIEAELRTPCFKLFDMIGGTSTGGIITAALTTPVPGPGGSIPFSASEIVEIYEKDGPRIFYPQHGLDFCARYYADDGKGNGIEPYLQEKVGPTTTLSAAHKSVSQLSNARIKHMFTAGYVVNQSGNSVPDPVLNQDFGPYLFNWHAAGLHSGKDYYVWEAARATSAAPTYFPIALAGGGKGKCSSADQRWVVDGGVMANNPAVWGLSEAFRLGFASSLSDITIISLGTGLYAGGAGVGIHNNAGELGLYPDNGNWDDVPWLQPSMYDLEGNKNEGTLLNIILDSVQLVAARQLHGLKQAGLKYYRLEPRLPESLSAMDNLGNISGLLTLAEQYLATEGKESFNEILALLRPPEAPASAQ